MFAGFVEKSCQIHFPSAVGIAGKTDGFDERFIFAIGVEKRAMNAAKVDKVQNAATENEKGLEIVFFGDPRKVDDPTALMVHRELTDAAKLAVARGAVSERFGTVRNAAKPAKAFLLRLFLNGQYF